MADKNKPVEDLVSDTYKAEQEERNQRAGKAISGAGRLPNERPSKAMKRYSISLTNKNLEQIDNLIGELGFASISEAVRGSIHALHSKTFPHYTRGREAIVSEQEVETIKPSKKAIDEQKKANELAHKVNICEQALGGVVAYDEDDQPVQCAYFQYDGRRRHLQEMDIKSVTTDLVESQYIPNKDYVTKLQAEGHIDYDLNETIEDIVEAEAEEAD